MSTELTKRLERCYVAAVYDVLNSLGHEMCVLPAAIAPLDPTKKLAGRVFTVDGHLTPGLPAHETLVRWTGLLSAVPPESVLVCQPNTHAVALMGELSAETLHFKEVRGYVVDGGCRDTDFILRLGFPVFCSFNTPADIVGRWAPDKLGEPITIGDVTICTGDWLLGDRDGVVVIPESLVAEVIELAEKVQEQESAVRTAVLQGVDPQEAYLKYGKF